jgi:NifU-like protein involved in Fe-S cluster formation
MLNLITKTQLTSLTLKLSGLYHENVIDHYEKPRNVGSLDKNNKNVGTGLVGAPACGDVMKLQIELNESGDTIQKAVFKVKINLS